MDPLVYFLLSIDQCCGDHYFSGLYVSTTEKVLLNFECFLILSVPIPSFVTFLSFPSFEVSLVSFINLIYLYNLTIYLYKITLFKFVTDISKHLPSAASTASLLWFDYAL
jgi:hypothetical protein